MGKRVTNTPESANKVNIERDGGGTRNIYDYIDK